MSVIHQIASNAMSADRALKSDDTAPAISDTLNLSRQAIGIMIHSAGAVRVTFADMRDGEYVDLPALTPGALYPFKIKRLWSTGTTVAASADITLFYVRL